MAPLPAPPTPRARGLVIPQGFLFCTPPALSESHVARFCCSALGHVPPPPREAKAAAWSCHPLTTLQPLEGMALISFFTAASTASRLERTNIILCLFPMHTPQWTKEAGSHVGLVKLRETLYRARQVGEERPREKPWQEVVVTVQGSGESLLPLAPSSP